jgi:hypothetical protein
VIEQAGRLRAGRDRAELVQRAAGRDTAVGLGGRVYPVQCVAVETGLARCQRVADHQVPVPVEPLAFGGQGRPVLGRSDRLRHGHHMLHRAWVGDMRAARSAGHSPAIAPMSTAAASPPAQASRGITVAQPLAWA